MCYYTDKVGIHLSSTCEYINTKTSEHTSDIKWSLDASPGVYRRIAEAGLRTHGPHRFETSSSSTRAAAAAACIRSSSSSSSSSSARRQGPRPLDISFPRRETEIEREEERK